MINWNQNDTKYILKRLILYFIIACIVFFAGHSCAKATISTATMGNIVGTNGNDRIHYANNSQNNSTFKGAGEGYIIGNYYINTSGGPNYPLKNFTAQTRTNGGTVYNTICEIGNQSGYSDSQTQWEAYTFKCPVAFGSDAGLYSFTATFIANNHEGWISTYITFVQNNNEASAIISANNQAIQNQINAGNTNSQAIQNAINQSTTNTVNAINNQTTAINNQTQAINDQTDWFDQDYSSIIDTEFLDVFDDLFDNDDDVVRQFILIPLNFFVLIYNACSSNSCSPIELGELYGTTLTIPCINWSGLVGTAVTNTIDIIFAGCLVFGMIRMIKKMINKIMTLSSTITDECGVEVFK